MATDHAIRCADMRRQSLQQSFDTVKTLASQGRSRREISRTTGHGLTRINTWMDADTPAERRPMVSIIDQQAFIINHVKTCWANGERRGAALLRDA